MFLKEILLKNVTFENKGIKEGLDDVDKDNNNIILCRNFWKYLEREELSNSTWKFSQKVDDKTLVIIGCFDMNYGGEMPFFLKDMGFQKIEKHNETGVILKQDSKAKNQTLLSNKDEWKKGIYRRYWGFIPNYLKYM